MGQKYEAGTWIGVLRHLCEELYKLDQISFRASLLSLRTPTGRPYFSQGQGEYPWELEMPNSGIFVVGKLLSSGVRRRCEKILRAMGIDPELDFSVEIEQGTPHTSV